MIKEGVGCKHCAVVSVTLDYEGTIKDGWCHGTCSICEHDTAAVQVKPSITKHLSHGHDPNDADKHCSRK